MATKYTNISRSIDLFNEFLSHNYSEFRDAELNVTASSGWSISYKHPQKLYSIITDIYNNLYDSSGLAPLFSDGNPATDKDVLEGLKSFQTMLEGYEKIIVEMRSTLNSYGFVEGLCAEMWFKTSSAVGLAISLAEQDLSRIVNFEVFLYDFGIIVATQKEFDAILPFIMDPLEVRGANNDSSVYTIGKFEKNGILKTVIVTMLPFMGMQAAAVSASKMIIHYKPRYLVILGHLAGNKNTTKFGDIIVGEISLDFHQVIVKQRKNKNGDNEKPLIETSGNQKPAVINGSLKVKLSKYVNDLEFLTAIKSASPNQEKFSSPINVRIGKIISGGMLLRSGEFFDTLKKEHPGLFGLDMETFGIYYAAENTTCTMKPIPVSIKAVSDYGDHIESTITSGDRISYACFNSAKFFYEIAMRDLD